MNSVLECLVAPWSPEEFFDRYWGKEYLNSKPNSELISNLFSWPSLYQILSTQRFEFPRLRVVRSGKVVPSEEYIKRLVDRRGNPFTSHDSRSLARFLESGCVLHITSIGEAWEPLANFAAQLELALDARVQVNVHAGFAASRGFDVHWDGHDVFAVQIEGKKRWRLFGFTEKAPLAIPPDQKHGAPTQSVWEGVLAAGDVLYIPRGYWHAAEAMEATSLHITFAVQHPTGYDFLSSMLTSLTTNSAVRMDMHFSEFDSVESGHAAKAAYLSGLKAAICDALTPEAIDVFASQFRASLGKTNHFEFGKPESKE